VRTIAKNAQPIGYLASASNKIFCDLHRGKPLLPPPKRAARGGLSPWPCYWTTILLEQVGQRQQRGCRQNRHGAGDSRIPIGDICLTKYVHHPLWQVTFRVMHTSYIHGFAAKYASTTMHFYIIWMTHMQCFPPPLLQPTSPRDTDFPLRLLHPSHSRQPANNFGKSTSEMRGKIPTHQLPQHRPKETFDH